MVTLFISLDYKVPKHIWEMQASDYICKIPTLTPKLWLFKMPDIQNYLLGFRRAVQCYKSWFLSKSSSGSKDQNNTVMMQLLEWTKTDFTMQRNYKGRPHNLLESFVHFWMLALEFLLCYQTVLKQEDSQAFISYLHLWDNPVLQFSRSVVSDSLRPRELQHARAPCPSPTPRACSNSCPSSQWCHPTISSSVVPFSPPAFSLSQHQGLIQWVSSLHQVAKGLELQLQHQSFQWIFRTDLL